MNKILTATAAAVGIGIGALTFSAIGPVSAQTTSSTSSEAAPTDSHRPGALRAGVRARFVREAARVAADKIGVSVADLRDAVRNGQSVAEVASDHGVNPDDVKQAIIDDITAKIDNAVQNGHLSADRAARLKDRLPGAVDRFMNFTRNG